jgi:hypothetical protein
LSKPNPELKSGVIKGVAFGVRDLIRRELLYQLWYQSNNSIILTCSNNISTHPKCSMGTDNHTSLLFGLKLRKIGKYYWYTSPNTLKYNQHILTFKKKTREKENIVRITRVIFFLTFHCIKIIKFDHLFN